MSMAGREFDLWEGWRAVVPVDRWPEDSDREQQEDENQRV
jgi:hypothetical protein